MALGKGGERRPRAGRDWPPQEGDGGTKSASKQGGATAIRARGARARKRTDRITVPHHPSCRPTECWHRHQSFHTAFRETCRVLCAGAPKRERDGTHGLRRGRGRAVRGQAVPSRRSPLRAPAAPLSLHLQGPEPLLQAPANPTGAGLQPPCSGKCPPPCCTLTRGPPAFPARMHRMAALRHSFCWQTGHVAFCCSHVCRARARVGM